MSLHELQAGLTEVCGHTSAAVQGAGEASLVIGRALHLLDSCDQAYALVNPSLAMEEARQRLGRAVWLLTQTTDSVAEYMSGIGAGNALAVPDSSDGVNRIGEKPFRKPVGEFRALADDDERKVLFTTRFGSRAARINQEVAATLAAHGRDEDDSVLRSLIARIPGYRGFGAEAVAITLEPGILIKTNPDYTPDDIRGYAASRRRAEGMDSLEQLICCNDEEDNLGVIVQEAPGPTVGALTQAEKEEIPDEHLERLADTIREMYRRGLAPDFEHPENVIYQRGSKPGFVIIDYSTMEEAIGAGQYFPPTIPEMAVAFGAGVLLRDLPSGSAIPDYAVRYYEACKRRLGDAVAAGILRYWSENGFIVDSIE